MLAVGESFDRFRIDALVGEGGMGQVYRALDTRLQRPVALKVILVRQDPDYGSESDTGDANARLLREARTAAGLEHPNMVSIYDVGELGGVAYIAMEYVSGFTLRVYVGKPSPPWARRLSWLLAVASALEAAHARGVVHRDVKPENIMLRDDGMVKVLDFGIARRTPPSLTGATGPSLGGAVTSQAISWGEARIVGTPAYMAPEQLGGAVLDGRADQFAFGVLAYELLAGALPWNTTHGALGLVTSLLSEPPRPLRGRAPELPKQVDDAVLRALAKNRDDRFPSMRELAAVLEPFSADSAARNRPTQVSQDRRAAAPSAVLSAPSGPASPRQSPPPTTSVITGTRAFSSAAPLAFKVDAEARFARFPVDFTLKGMFFTRIVAMAPRHVESVRAKLAGPPRGGRYLPFSDYPQVDYSRIAHAVAIGLRPELPVPEAMRQLARVDFVTFASSAMGRVSLALMRDVGTALLRLPDAFGAVMRGGTVLATRIGRDVFEITFRDFFGWVDCYPIGTIEGLVKHFGASCSVTVDVQGGFHAVYRVQISHEPIHA